MHIGSELITDLLCDRAGRPTGLPVFTDPLLRDPVLMAALGPGRAAQAIRSAPIGSITLRTSRAQRASYSS